MATKIIMPKLGMAMKDGTVVKWLKDDGAEVKKGEPVVVVMSKKITYEVQAPADGILRQAARPKSTHSIAQTIGFITAPGEEMPEVEAAPPPEAVPVTTVLTTPAAPVDPKDAVRKKVEAPAEREFVPSSPAARRLAKELGVDISRVTPSGKRITESDVQRYHEEQSRVLATSVARRMAQEEGLDLTQIQGTGPGGRITEEDVLRALEAPKAPPKIIRFIGMRQAIAEQMVHSLQTMAQVTLLMEVDATELVKVRQQLKADFDLTYTDLLIKAVTKALKRHPDLNATLIGDEIHLLEPIHIGVAVALPDGLIVPVVRDADKRTLQEIAQEVRRLAQAAREGSLAVDEVTGGTFTITNLGAYGVDGFTPIINPPEVAILGVGRIVEKPVIREGQFVRGAIMMLSLTIDHRIVDGAPGADFLRTLKELLESPYRLLA